MSTEHEARARRAKAVALATVLADTSAIDDPRCVRDLTVPGWELAARAATERNLLGQGRTVHIPNSPETVAAVERELRMLQVEQRVDVEQPATDAGRPGQPTEWKAGDKVRHRDGLPEATFTLVRPEPSPGEWNGQWLVRSDAAEGLVETWWDLTAETTVRVDERRATDSAGYRAEMRRLVPVPNRPEPTDDDLFAAFAQADRR